MIVQKLGNKSKIARQCLGRYSNVIFGHGTLPQMGEFTNLFRSCYRLLSYPVCSKLWKASRAGLVAVTMTNVVPIILVILVLILVMVAAVMHNLAAHTACLATKGIVKGLMSTQ